MWNRSISSESAPECGAGPEKQTCLYCRLGRVDYMRAWELQGRLAQTAAAGGPDTLLLLEHPPTYTLGRRGNESNLLVSREMLAGLGATVIQSDRGGDITFHGPGQLVGYPIMNLARLGTGIGAYLRSIEETLIRALSSVGVSAQRCAGYTGVWVNDEKIAAIGVKITAGRITQHGFAINLNTDLCWFRNIVPCGIGDRDVTNLARLLGREIDIHGFAGSAASAFGSVFNRDMIEVGPEELWG